MIIGQSGSIIRLLAWQWKFLVVSGLASVAVCVGYIHLDLKWLVLPSLPLAVVGAALGIFVSFRTNSAYDRWWEGRKLWGRMINTSRHMAIQSIRYFHDSDQESVRQKLVRRHIAYVHSLRCILREQDPFEDEVVLSYLSDEERAQLPGTTNLTARLLDHQLHDLVALVEDGKLSEFRLSDFDESVRHLLDIQGGCERIKKTPLPRIYGFISERLILWFGSLLPCALVADLGWVCVPISILVTLGFKLISETGRVLEDPFTLFWNALPLMALSNTIERNLLELLGEKEIPEATKPINGWVLM